MMCATAGKRRKKIREPEITGVKYCKKLLPLLEQLHSRRLRPRQGRQSPTALRTVLTLILLYLFNPVATNLLDMPAETIAVLYEHRWTIEIFFRFFKHILSYRHLLSHDEHGIEIQTYCVIIACMLISLWTCRKPTLRSSLQILLQILGAGLLLHLTVGGTRRRRE